MISKFAAKLKNLWLFALCLGYWIFRGSAKTAPDAVKRVLIFRSKPHVGDMVYVTPLFRAIKQTHPDARVTLVGGGRVGEVVAGNPDIDELIPYQGNFFATLRRLRRERFDFACLANLGSIEGLALLYLSGAKCVSVFTWMEAGQGTWLYNRLKRLVVTKPFQSGVYVPPLYLALLDPIQANTGDAHFRLYYSDKAKNRVLQLFAENNIDQQRDLIVGLAVGGSTEDRWWPAERFAALGRYLHEKYKAKLFLIGAGKDERPITDTVRHLGDTPVVSLLNQPLDEFKAFIAHSKLIIGNDSGPMVTADAFDIPNLVLVGPTDEREYHRPPGPLNRIAEAEDKKIGSLTVESVIKELNIILPASSFAKLMVGKND